MGILGNWVSQAKMNFTSRSMQLSRSASQMVNSAQSTLFGRYDIMKMRGNIESYFARQLMDDRYIIADIKQMRKSAKQFRKLLSQKKIVKIGKRFPDGNREAEELKRLFADAVPHLYKFISAFSDLNNRLKETLLNQHKLSIVHFQSVIGILQEIVKAEQEERAAYIDPSLSLYAKEAIAKQIKKEIKRQNKQHQEDAAIQSNAHPRSNMMVRIFGAFWIGHKLRKFTKKIRNAEIRDFRENLIQLNREILSGTVDQTTLNRLKNHSKSFQKTEKYIHELAHDANLFIDLIKQLVDDLMEANSEAIASLNKKIYMAKAIEAMQRLKEQSDNLTKVTVEDEQSTDKMIGSLESIENSLNNLFDKLDRASEQNLIKFRQSFMAKA